MIFGYLGRLLFGGGSTQQPEKPNRKDINFTGVLVSSDINFSGELDQSDINLSGVFDYSNTGTYSIPRRR